MNFLCAHILQIKGKVFIMFMQLTDQWVRSTKLLMLTLMMKVKPLVTHIVGFSHLHHFLEALGD